jgi:hypothetical protein
VNIGNHIISRFSEATPLNFVHLSKTVRKEWLLDSRDNMLCDIHTNLIDPVFSKPSLQIANMFVVFLFASEYSNLFVESPYLVPNFLEARPSLKNVRCVQTTPYCF